MSLLLLCPRVRVCLVERALLGVEKSTVLDRLSASVDQAHTAQRVERSSNAAIPACSSANVRIALKPNVPAAAVSPSASVPSIARTARRVEKSTVPDRLSASVPDQAHTAQRVERSSNAAILACSSVSAPDQA